MASLNLYKGVKERKHCVYLIQLNLFLKKSSKPKLLRYSKCSSLNITNNLSYSYIFILTFTKNQQKDTWTTTWSWTVLLTLKAFYLLKKQRLMLTCRGHDLWFANIWSRCNLENHCYYDRSSEHFKNYDLQFYKAHICITSSLLWIVKIIVNGAPEHSRGLWTVCRKNSKNLSLRYLVPDSCFFEFLFKLLTWLFVKGKFINFSCVFFQHTFPFSV